jgi:hypothetical protein
LVDRLFATETMKFIHEGASYNRMHKVAIISQWEEAQKHLRVCVNHKGNFGIYNCSYCEKCISTMIMLKIVGQIEKFQTFRQPFKYWDILRLGLQYNARNPMRWFTSYVIEKKKYHILLPVLMAYFFGWSKNIIAKLLPEYIERPLKKLIYPKRKKEYPRGEMS